MKRGSTAVALNAYVHPLQKSFGRVAAGGRSIFGVSALPFFLPLSSLGDKVVLSLLSTSVVPLDR